jgi:hypothetical protein
MNKTLQEQYNLIKEGKGNKQQFFKSARHIFPDLVTPVNTFEDTVRILKNRGIIAEGIGGLVTKGTTPDWHAIFKGNITEETKKVVNAKQNGDKSYTVEYSDGTTKVIYVSNDAWDDLNDKYGTANLKEAKEAKAVEKEPTKDVVDMETKGYDYKDKKNYDNVFGQEFLQGFYTEMSDSKNEGKTVKELRAIVAKNLAKDINHYIKDGQFGLKGVGYQTEAPGLGTPKEAKGKHKSSGYGDLKESVLRSQIHLLIKEILAEDEKEKIEFEEEDGYKINGKNVDMDSLEVEDINTNDYPDFVDAYISYAEFEDGTPLNNSELDELNDDGELVYNYVINSLYESKKPSAGLTKKK